MGEVLPELKLLRQDHLVSSSLVRSGARSIRFFCTLSTPEKVEDFLVSASASVFGEVLTKTAKGRAREVSVYTGQGDFRILLKFRLDRFFYLREILTNVLEESAKMHPAKYSPQTFVEMDDTGHIESDDGSIVYEATEYARHHLNFA